MATTPGSIFFSGIAIPPGPPGPPFDPTSADNGLSVDVSTGRIVLGDDPGGVLSTFLNNREIPLDNFTLKLINSLGDNTEMGGNGFLIGNAANTFFSKMSVEPLGALLSLETDITAMPIVQLLNGSSSMRMRLVGDDLEFVEGPSNVPMERLSFINGSYGIGDLDNFANGSKLLIDDSGSLVRIDTAINASIASVALAIDGVAGLFRFGDIDVTGAGSQFSISLPTEQVSILNRIGASNAVTVFLSDAGTESIFLGDIDGVLSGMKFQVDMGNDQFRFGNNANNSILTVNGQNGLTGSFGPVITNITVEGGIVTAIS